MLRVKGYMVSLNPSLVLCVKLSNTAVVVVFSGSDYQRFGLETEEEAAKLFEWLEQHINEALADKKNK